MQLPPYVLPNKICSPWTEIYDAFFLTAGEDLSGYIKGSCCPQQMRGRKGGKHFYEKQHNTAPCESTEMGGSKIHSILSGILPPWIQAHYFLTSSAL